MIPKSGRVVLKGNAYLRFKYEVHALDNWKCRICPYFGRSAIRALTVHHMIKRSKLRLDVVTNAISTCVECHERIERGELIVSWIDAEKRTVSVEQRNSFRTVPR